MPEQPKAYTVLARKYRPTTFPELIGQEALVQTLSNAIKLNRIAHAFLLTGIRGIGKTTTARLIARALNCIGPDGKGSPTIHPCGECEHCIAISEDRHTDVLEMDAASKTGVGDIREVIENSRYLPVSARYKIYIIDEVHMLSNNAFNALLKTLEEPPAHVKFIFATTELRKIPITIISRCQRFDLKRIDTELLGKHLRNVTKKEGFTIEEEALNLITQAAEGSARDGLSLLDQAIAHSDATDDNITAAPVRNMLGLADRSHIFQLFKQLVNGDIQATLAAYQSHYEAGGNAISILRELLELCHFTTRFKLQPDLKTHNTIPEAERKLTALLAEQATIGQLARLWQMLLKGLQEALTAPNSYSAVEMVLIRISHSSTLPTPESVIREFKQHGVVSTAPVANTPAPTPITTTPIDTPTLASEKAGKTVTINSFDQLLVLCKSRRELVLYHHLVEDVHVVKCEPGKLILRPTSHAPQNLIKQLKPLLDQWTGINWQISLTHEEEGSPTVAQQEMQSEENAKQDAANHPVVQKVMETFPGATISEVQETEKIAKKEIA